MKRTIFVILVSCSVSGCLFNVETRSFAKYKMNDTAAIELVYINAGATSKNIIEVRKITDSKTVVLDKIMDFNDTWKVDFTKLNDSLLKIKFTDTSIFIGNSAEYVVNLNSKFDPLSK